MRAHDYTPLFRLAHMVKDVALCLELDGAVRGAERALEDLRAAERAGHGDDDFAALRRSSRGARRQAAPEP